MIGPIEEVGPEKHGRKHRMEEDKVEENERGEFTLFQSFLLKYLVLRKEEKF